MCLSHSECHVFIREVLLDMLCWDVLQDQRWIEARIHTKSLWNEPVLTGVCSVYNNIWYPHLIRQRLLTLGNHMCIVSWQIVGDLEWICSHHEDRWLCEDVKSSQWVSNTERIYDRVLSGSFELMTHSHPFKHGDTLNASYVFGHMFHHKTHKEYF